MEPKPQDATATGNGTANATTSAFPADSTTARPASASTSEGGTHAAADGKDNKTENGDVSIPKGGRTSRSSSILKREHDRVWSDYFSEINKTADIAASLNAGASVAAAGTPAAAAAAQKDAEAAAAAAVRAKQRASARKSMLDIVGREQVTMRSALHQKLGSIFDSYDRNHSGDMDEPELRQVLEDYLTESKRSMQRLADTLFAPDGELRKILLASAIAEGKSQAEAEQSLTGHIEALKVTFNEKARQQMERMEAVRLKSQEFAKQLLADLDRNADGHVSRGEFMNSFQDKVEAIVA